MNPRSIESWAVVNGKEGDVFYTEKKDKDITSIATKFGKKVSTEKVILITISKPAPEVKFVTKVTIIK